MRALTPDAEEFMVELREEYLNQLEQHGVESAYDYLEFADCIDNLKDAEETREYLIEEGISLDAFLHLNPMLDQDVMYSSLNPGFPDTIKTGYFDTGHYGRHHRTGGDVEELAFQVASHSIGYLAGNRGPTKVLSYVQDELDELPSTDEVPFEDYVNVESREDLSSSYFGDVYHTRFFKLASPKGPFIKKFDKSYWRRRFVDEINQVNPKIVISGCKDVWLSILDYLVDDSSEIVPHSDAPVTRSYKNGSSSSAVLGVFEVPEEQLWIVTIYHEAYPHFIDFEQFEANLSYVNDRAFT